MDSNRTEAHDRTVAWGMDRRTVMDRVGTWLSAAKIARALGPLKGKDLGDFGCGHRGWLTQNLLSEVKSAVLIDVSLDEALKTLPNVRAIEGVLPDALTEVATSSLDAVVCNNVVEHLWNRRALIEHVRRVLRPGGRAFINVPSWRGRWVLETAAFRWGLTSRSEIDDHKAYFDPRELWLLLVEGGFRPSEIRCTSHKFRLNTCAVCTVGTSTR